LRHAGWNGSQTDKSTADHTIGPETSTDYDAASRMTQITTNDGETTVAFGYDNANRKISEDQTLAGYPTRRVNSPRDADGNRTGISVPSTYSLTYAYTGRNQLAAVNGYATFTYDKSGNTTNRVGTWLHSNGAAFTYDPLNRVTEIEQSNGTAVFIDSHYQYDTVGREVATWRDEDSNKGERFWYNPTNQLTSVYYKATNVWSAPTAPASQTQYAYDPDQLNRSSVTVNGVVKTLDNSGINQYTTANGQTVATYDDKFNLTSYAGNSFTYNAENQLVDGSLQATYDGLGRCVKRTVAGVTLLFTYDDWKPIVEWNSAGSWLASNIYGAGPDEILARAVSTGRHVIYKQDQHGNVMAVLDAAGNLTEKYTYDAFGAPTVLNGSGTVLPNGTAVANRFLFQGREWIATLGVYDYRHRYYNPDLGRFLQVDPSGFDAGDMNLFRYCDDAPVDLSDPMGLYARGSGWSARDWDFFDQSQRAAADATEQALAKTERALANGGKAMEDAKAAYEKAFGPGSATRENLARIAMTLQHMEEALRDDGSKGYYANAVYLGNKKSMQPEKGGYTYSSDRKSIYINVDSRAFRESGPWGSADQGRQWITTHESSHNFGTEDKIGKGTSLPAYKFAYPTQFKRLPNMHPEKALQNADTVTSFVYP
jgi:RHS repeat-associated protein